MLIGIDANEANVTRRVGVNQYAFGLLHALNTLQTRHRFLVYLKEPLLSDMPHIGENWRYRTIPFPRLWTQTRLPWDLFTHYPRPDVFFTPSHYAPRWSPVPTVISIMDLGFLQAPGQFKTRDFNQLKSWTAYSAGHAAKIIAISEYTRQDVISTYSRSPQDVVVTYPGFDKKLFKPAPFAKTLKKYGIRTPYILFLSSLKPSKNAEGLIKAFATLNHPDLSLVIAGKKAWLYESIFNLVEELKLTDRVVFTGFVDDPEVPGLMTSAQALVMPSFHEGFGIPVVEAMSCGTPVVVSRVASLPEVTGEAGIYVTPGDISSIAGGIETALGSDRDKYIKLGIAQAGKFSWDKTARATLKVLESARIL